MLIATQISAQRYDISLNYSLTQEISDYQIKNKELFHQAIRPFNQWFVSDNSFNKTFKDSSKFYYDATVLLYKKHLLEIHQKDVHIGMDLLFNISIGNRYFQNDDDKLKRVSTNTRGFRIVANIGNNVSFETQFYENQFFFPNYMDSIVSRRGVAFGVGRTKPFKTNGFDAGYAVGWLNYKVSKTLNIKFGHSKMFIGNGYRSLLISDNSSPFPMLNFHFQSPNKKWSYLSTFAWLQSLNRSITTVSTEALFKRKNATIHYLSFKPNPKIEIGVFESTIFKSYDDSLGFVNPSPFFFNPIIGINSSVFGLNSVNNSLLGLNASYTFKDYQFYGQIAIDNWDKIGYQAGIKWYSPFHLDKNWIQVEFNHAPAYMYSTSNVNLLQNYTHMNQELAHPIGASFNEIVLLYHYYKDHWFGDAEICYSTRKRGTTQQYGENIFRPNDPLFTNALSGVESISTFYWKIEGGYQFNIKTRMQLFGSINQRILNNHSNDQRDQRDFFFVFGIRCALNNFYYDI